MPGHSHHSTGEGSEPNSMKPLEISQTQANSIKAANKHLIKSAIPGGGEVQQKQQQRELAGTELFVSLLHKDKSD